MALTLTDLQQRIHQRYEGSTDYPSSDSDDYLVRLGLINQRILDWESETTDWRELFVNVQNASDGDLTTTDDDLILDCPTDFIRISSWVKINDIYYEYISNNHVLITQENDSGKRFFTITGKPGAYKINLSHDPGGTYTIYYSYYKEAAELSSASDVAEMSRPQFIINGVLADLYEQDNRNDMVEFYTNKADESMEQMMIENEMYPSLNNYTLLDVGYNLTGESFGT